MVDVLMNKKYSFLVAVLMFFSTGFSFAAEGSVNVDRYNRLARAYNDGNLNTVAIPGDIAIVEGHKVTLEARKRSIESSYVPALLRIVGASLSIPAIFTFGAAVGGAAGSYAILSSSNSGVNFLEWLKYTYGLDKSMVTSGKMAFTTRVFLPTLSETHEAILELGTYAPPLAAVSFVAVALSRYFFNKAANYKDEIVKLEKEIIRDTNIILSLIGFGLL